MVFGFSNQQTAWEKADNAIEDLLKAAREFIYTCLYLKGQGLTIRFRRLAQGS